MATLADFFEGSPVLTPGTGLNNSPYAQTYNNEIKNGSQEAAAANTGQQALGQALTRQANGIGPSVAQTQFNQNNQRVAAQAAGAVASQKGINPGLGGQLIARNQAAIQGQGAETSALARTQEQLGAQAQLGNLYNQEGQLGLGTGALGTQGTLGQNQDIINQQQIQAGQQASNVAQGTAIAGGILKGASSAIGVGAAHGGYAGAPLDFKMGGEIPGKAKVQGDSPKNDTVPIMASPEEIMIPRSITMHPQAGELAKRFVEGIIATRGKKGQTPAPKNMDLGGDVGGEGLSGDIADSTLPTPDIGGNLPGAGGATPAVSDPISDALKRLSKAAQSGSSVYTPNGSAFSNYYKSYQSSLGMADGGTVPYFPAPLPYEKPAAEKAKESQELPNPPLIRADVPLPFNGGSFDRYAPLKDQMKRFIEKTHPDAGTSKSDPKPEQVDDVEVQDAGTSMHKTQFYKGGKVHKHRLGRALASRKKMARA